MKRKMMLTKMAAMLLILGFIGVGQAYADYLFTFNSNDSSFHVSGTLSITPSSSGIMNVTDGSLGAATLFNSGSWTPQQTSPSGAFWFDNVLSPSPGSGQQMLTYWGLLFREGSQGTSGYKEINIYGNPGVLPTETNYSYMEWIQGGWSPDLRGTFSISALNVSTNASAVPIPNALYLLGSGVVGLVAVRRRFQK